MWFVEFKREYNLHFYFLFPIFWWWFCIDTMNFWWYYRHDGYSYGSIDVAFLITNSLFWQVHSLRTFNMRQKVLVQFLNYHSIYFELKIQLLIKTLNRRMKMSIFSMFKKFLFMSQPFKICPSKEFSGSQYLMGRRVREKSNRSHYCVNIRRWVSVVTVICTLCYMFCLFSSTQMFCFRSNVQNETFKVTSHGIVLNMWPFNASCQNYCTFCGSFQWTERATTTAVMINVTNANFQSFGNWNSNRPVLDRILFFGRLVVVVSFLKRVTCCNIN